MKGGQAARQGNGARIAPKTSLPPGDAGARPSACATSFNCWFGLVLLGCALLGTACAAVRTSSNASDASTAIREANDRLAADSRTHDVELLVRNFYAREPIVAYGSGRLARGYEAAKAAWQDMLGSGTITLETERIESSCDMVSEVGRWRLRVEASEGDYRQEMGVYHVTWKRIEGRWKAVMHTFLPGGFEDTE
jgi:ketosteroid isomerase-like protein